MTDPGGGAWRSSEYVRAAKALCACARRVAGLQQQLNAALAQLGAQLSALYGADAPARAAACEACIAPVVGEACAALKQGEHLRPAAAFARAWADAERWLSDASRALRSGSSGSGGVGGSSGGCAGGVSEDTELIFFEQRYDGLDGAACAFVRAVLSALAPSSVAACALRRHLAATQRVAAVAATATAPPVSPLSCDAASLAPLLRARVPAQYLRMLLAAQMREESLDFCLAVLSLEATAAADAPPSTGLATSSSGGSDEEDVACLAQEIVARFVAPSAPQQINVSGATRAALVAAARRVPPDVRAFVEAKDELVQALQCDDTLRQFRASPYYRRLQRRLAPAPWAAAAATRSAPVAPASPSEALPSPTTPTAPLQMPAPRARPPRDPRTPGAPSMDDVVRTPALARSFREFLREKGAARPLEFCQAVEALLRRHAPSSDGSSGGSSAGSGHGSSHSSGSSSNSEGNGGSGSGGNGTEGGIRAEAAQLYEEYLVPRAEDVPLGVPHELRCELYGAVYDAPAGATSDSACAALLRQAAAAAMDLLRATEHPLYVLSERWRPLWRAPAVSRARSRSVASVNGDNSNSGASGNNSGSGNSVRTRTSSLAGPGAVPDAFSSEATATATTADSPLREGGEEDKDEQQREEDGRAYESETYLASTKELAGLLQTRFVPGLQRLASSVKAVATAADLAPHQGEVRALLAALRALGGVAGPAAVRAPDFASVAAVYAHDAALAQFMVRVHRGVWEVTAKVAALIRALDAAAAAHRADAQRLAHYWHLYHQLCRIIAVGPPSPAQQHP